MSELSQAVRNNDETKVQKLLKGGMFSKPATKEEINLALFDAISVNNYAIILLLVQAGANGKGSVSSPLLAAVKKGNLNVIKLLCNNGAELPYHKDENNPLWYAVLNWNLPVVKYFLEEKKFSMYGYDSKGDDIFSWTYHKSSYDGDEKKREANEKAEKAMYDYLKTKAQPIAERQRVMVATGDLEGLKKSLTTELSSNNEAEYLLQRAIACGHLPIVKYLVEEREGQRQNKDQQHFDEAVESGHLPIIKYFVETRKVDVNKRSEYGNKEAALLTAIRKNDSASIEYLLGKGAKLDNLDNDGTTALIKATSFGHEGLVKDFVTKYRANINQADKKGNTPILTAAIFGHLNVMKYFVELGVDVKQANHITGATPLLESARYGRMFILKYLREEKHCALDVRDKSNQSIFDYGKNQQSVLLYLNTAITDIHTSTATNNSPNVGAVINQLGQISVSLEIPQDKITKAEKLGEGGFGVVYRGKWQGIDVAVKTLHVNNFSSNGLEDFKHETSIMAKLRHKNIILLYGVCLTQPYSMVMEFAAKGSLSAQLHNNEQMDWPLRLKIALGAVNGISFLHSQTPTILHRDIKSMNLLLDDTMNPKWTDFGLAKLKDNVMTTSTTAQNGIAGTLHWMAPELLDGKETPHTTACDVYSLGILLWEISSRKLPYDGKNPKQIYATVVLREEREKIPADCPVKFSNIIAAAWKQNPKERIEIKTMISELEKQHQEANVNTSAYMSFS